MPVEIEIKLPVSNVESARAAILGLGYAVHHEREHEWNAVFDSRTLRLRGKGVLLRLRQFGPTATLTFKGASVDGRHKQREEIETAVSDAEAAALILDRLGLRPVFRYEKYRTEYTKPGEHGIVTVDETPIGNFLELEGPPAWIDNVAGLLGFQERDYIKLSYGALYNQHCQSTGTKAADMLFEAKAHV